MLSPPQKSESSASIHGTSQPFREAKTGQVKVRQALEQSAIDVGKFPLNRTILSRNLSFGDIPYQ